MSDSLHCFLDDSPRCAHILYCPSSLQASGIRAFCSGSYECRNARCPFLRMQSWFHGRPATVDDVNKIAFRDGLCSFCSEPGQPSICTAVVCALRYPASTRFQHGHIQLQHAGQHNHPPRIRLASDEQAETRRLIEAYCDSKPRREWVESKVLDHLLDHLDSLVQERGTFASCEVVCHSHRSKARLPDEPFACLQDVDAPVGPKTPRDASLLLAFRNVRPQDIDGHSNQAQGVSCHNRLPDPGPETH